MAELVTTESSTQFISVKIVENVKYKVLFLNVLCAQPTPLQWESFKRDLTSSLTTINASKSRFAFLLDVRKLGLLSVARIKEFIAILRNFEKCIEEYAMCSTVIIEARAVKLICGLFLTFYKTKKPLHFLKDKESCVKKINDYYNGNVDSQEGIDYNDLGDFS